MQCQKNAQEMDRWRGEKCMPKVDCNLSLLISNASFAFAFTFALGDGFNPQNVLR